MTTVLFLSLSGLLVGILAGLFGIGGGLILIPALLYIPPVLGMTSLPIHTITGLSVTLGLAANVTSYRVHRQHGQAVKGLLPLGVVAMLGSVLGGVATGFFPEKLLKLLLLLVLCVPLWFTLRPLTPAIPVDEHGNGHTSEVALNALKSQLLSPLFMLITFSIGLLAGLMGIGGAFLLSPLLYGWLRVPIHLAIGTTAGLVLLISLAAFAGKAVTGYIAVEPATWITLTGLLGGFLGGKLTHKTSAHVLRKGYGCIILLAFIRTLCDVLLQ